jgi:hypothetical protein
MSLTIGFSDGIERGFEDVPGEVETAYQVLPSGVLLHLRRDKGEHWTVVFEYSPNSWAHVYGTRYIAATDKLQGTDGVVKAPAGRMMVV